MSLVYRGLKLTWLLPPLGLGSLYAAALVAWQTLGRWPRVAHDDPGSIEGAMTFVYPLSFLFMEVMILGYACSIVVVVGFCFCGPSVERRAMFRALGASLATAVVFAIWLSMDPHSVVAWYLD